MKIGILGAMVGEIQPILEAVQNSENVEVSSVSHGGNTFHEITFLATEKILAAEIPAKTELVLAYSKVGKVYSAITATLMIEKFKVDRIIFTGVAGGLAKNVKIGDIVIGKQTLQHDVDITGVSKEFTKGHVAMPTEKFSENGGWKADAVLTACDSKMIEKCENILKSENKKYHVGTIATGDIFCGDLETKRKIGKSYEFLEEEILAVEMEGGSVNKVCEMFEIPCLVIRSISDDGDGNLPEDFGKFMYEVALTSADLAVKLVASLT